MATITKGILGGFSGTVGTVVGANFRGKDIIRSRPKPSGKAPTIKQLLQQDKFRLVAIFLQPLKGIQNKYFGATSGARSKTNLATSYTLNNAIDVVLNVPSLLFNKILITKGDLAAFQDLTATPAQDQKVKLVWLDNSLQGNAAATDVVNAVFYSELSGNFEIYTAIATRDNGNAEIALPAFYAGQDLHVWLFLSNSKENSACNSSYLGVQTIL